MLLKRTPASLGAKASSWLKLGALLTASTYGGGNDLLFEVLEGISIGSKPGTVEWVGVEE